MICQPLPGEIEHRKRVQTIFLMAFIFVSAVLTACSPPEGMTVKTIHIGPPTFSLPTGLATDAADHLFVFDSGNHRVLKFDQNGDFITEWGKYGTAAGEFNCYEDKGTICGIAVDSQGNVYVVDKGNYRIQKFDPDGNFLAAWGSRGTGDGQFIRPIYVAVDLQGNVYVTDDRNPVVQKFDSNGKFLLKWGSFGTGEGQFRHATGIATDGDGNVYVADYENERIQKFDRNGQFLMAWNTGTDGKSGIPEAIAVDENNRIYVTDSKLKQIEIFNTNGKLLEGIDLQGKGLRNQMAPYGIAIDSSGNLFVSDRQNNRVLKY